MRDFIAVARTYVDDSTAWLWMGLAFLGLMAALAFKIIGMAAGPRDPCGCFGSSTAQETAMSRVAPVNPTRYA